MTAEQSMLRDTIRSIFHSFSDLASPESFKKWPSPLWIELEKIGVTGIAIPESAGGSGGSFVDAATAVFEVGRSAAAIPFAETTMLCGWLIGLVGWEWTGSAETAAFVNGPAVECRRESHSLTLSGRVDVVPWARTASRILLLVATGGGAYIVSLEPRDFSVVPSENLAGEPRDTVVIEGITVNADRWAISPISLDDFRIRGALIRSVAMAGAISSVADATNAFALEREQFGRPIARFQAVQQLLARVTEESVAAITSTRAAVDAVDTNGAAIAALAATVRARKAATRVARMAHQVHGAIGIAEEFPLHYWTSRLWSWRNDFGSEAEWSERLATWVRNRGGADELWPMLTDNFDVATKL